MTIRSDNNGWSLFLGQLKMCFFLYWLCRYCGRLQAPIPWRSAERSKLWGHEEGDMHRPTETEHPKQMVFRSSKYCTCSDSNQIKPAWIKLISHTVWCVNDLKIFDENYTVLTRSSGKQFVFPHWMQQCSQSEHIWIDIIWLWLVRKKAVLWY